MANHDPEALQRGYRYFRALQVQRRGYVVIRELVQTFLAARRWTLRRHDDVERAALELVDALMTAGALAPYAAGLNAEACAEHAARARARATDERAAEIRRAANEARDDERRRVDARIAELDAEREAERYLARNKGDLEKLEREAREKAAGVIWIRPRRGGGKR